MQLYEDDNMQDSANILMIAYKEQVGRYDYMNFKTCYKQDPYGQTMILMK